MGKQPTQVFLLGRYEQYECPNYLTAFLVRADAEAALERITAHLALTPDIDHDLIEKNGDEWDRQWNAQRAHFAACADDPTVSTKDQDYVIHEYPLVASTLPRGGERR